MEKSGKVPELDLVFACDCTSSMGSYIDSAKASIRSIMEAVKASEKRDVRFALVSYRDHGDEYVARTDPWTSKTQEAFGYVSNMSAQGGGDSPEAVAEALDNINNLNFRKSATRICVFVADAPPHGICNGDDSYPNGSPNKIDPIVLVNELVKKEVIIYSVGCEPQLGSSNYGRDFFKAIAFMTGGKYIALGNAGVLPNIIIGGAEEELELEKLSSAMQEEEASVKKQDKNLSTEEVHKKVAENLAKKGVKCTKLKVDDYGDGAATEVSKRIAQCRTLAEVREYLTSHIPKSAHQEVVNSYGAPPTSTSFFGGVVNKISSYFGAPKPSPTIASSPIYSSESYSSPMYDAAPPTHYDYASQKAENCFEDVSYDQVSRVMNRKAASHF